MLEELVRNKTEQKAKNLTDIWELQVDCDYMQDIKQLLIDSKVGCCTASCTHVYRTPHAAANYAQDTRVRYYYIPRRTAF